MIPSPGEELPSLSWRSDSKQTFSDWKIRVVHGDAEWIYNVHKCILACGPRGSRYFFRLFMNGGFKESVEQQSTIVMDHKEAAMVFPYLLDFVYRSHAGIPFNAHNVVALCHLGEYFGISRLQERSAEALKSLLPEHVAEIYQHADRFGDEEAMRAIGMSLHESGKWSDLLARYFLSPHVWEGVCQSIELRASSRTSLKAQNDNRAEESRKWSREVASICVDGRLLLPLNREMFDRFVDEKVLHHVDGDAAVRLLVMDHVLGESARKMVSSSLEWRCSKALRRYSLSDSDRKLLCSMPTESVVSLLSCVARLP